MSVEPWRLAAAAALVLAYAGLCAALLWRERRRCASARRDASTLAASSDPASTGPATLVVFASQTGQAEAVAWRTGRALHARGVPVRVLPLDDLDEAALGQARRALFIASTYGEGDAPDGASLFVERWMGEAANPTGHASAAPSLQLPDLSYALLALGDRQYRQFCGFGRRLDEWLQHRGARPEFDRIEADNLEADAMAAWQRQLGLAPSGIDGDEAPADADGPFSEWTLRRRECLNPGSAGAPIFLLVFEAPSAGTRALWSSGDLAQILVPGDESRPRDYSIASIQADGAVELLVRQARHADGRIGLASAWLSTRLEPGGTVRLRLRPHPRFRLDANIARPLLLVGNGTGLAGLRSHLRARALAGHGDNWLVFGERNARFDSLCRDEIERWKRAGVLTRIDRVFSRDQAERRYVQHVLLEAADEVRRWIDRGAAIYVCGSLEGMAGGVDSALRELAGPARYERLVREGRYRRDVY